VLYTWSRLVSDTEYYRVYAIIPEGKQLLKPGVVVANTTQLPSIEFDQSSSPLSGLAHIAISGNNPLIKNVKIYKDLIANSLSYYYYNRGISSSSSHWPAFEQRWDTTRDGNGSHLLEAVVEMQPSSFVHLQATADIENIPTTPNQPTTPNPIGLSNRTLIGSSANTTPLIGQYDVQINASSTNGIVLAQLSVDDNNALSLSTKNSHWGIKLGYCAEFPTVTQCIEAPETGYPYYYYNYNIYNQLNAYTWRLPNLLPGLHTLHYQVTDSLGFTRETSSQLFIQIPIQLNTPFNSEGVINIRNPNLLVSGNIGTIQNNNEVEVSISLGQIEIYRQVGSNFTANYDLTGLALGDYTLRVVARDTVTNRSSSMSKTIHFTPTL